MALDKFFSYTKALAAWLASNCQDESQLLQGKALQDVNQQIADFLANMRTELATPINGIIGYLKLITDGLTDSREEEQEFINSSPKGFRYT